jgi:hypothetical protein
VYELASALSGLVAMGLIPAIVYGVIALGRGRPWLAVLCVAAATLIGAAALSLAGRQGFTFAPEVRRVIFASDNARYLFRTGHVLLTLAVPAWALVVLARVPQTGESLQEVPVRGPVGLQWVVVLFGYWLAAVIWGFGLYSLVTGQIK